MVLLIRSIALIACIVALGLHLVGLHREAVQPDEFEHLHAAWLVSQGQTPYVDFFQHHTPLFYYVAAPFLLGPHLDFDTILNLRLLILLFWVFTTLIGCLWLRRYGQFHGLLAICTLASNATMLSLGHIIFLDTVSIAPLVLSGMLIAGGDRKPKWMLASGIFFGFAVLINLKASMAMFAPMMIMGSRAWGARKDRRRFQAWLVDCSAYLAGGLIAILLLVTILGSAGSTGLWRYCVELNLGWKARVSGVPTLLGLFRRDLFLSCTALALVAQRLLVIRRRHGFSLEDRDVPWLFLTSLIAGVFILPVVWMEYFAMLVPFLMLSGAVALGDWLSEVHDEEPAPGVRIVANSRFARYSFVVLVLFSLLALIPFRAFLRSDPFAILQSAMILALSAILTFSARRAWRPESALSLAMCLSLVTIVPIVRVGTVLHREDNFEQRRRLQYVMANTRPQDSVFDGYTGYGVFRPHAYYFWMLHEEVQAMLDEHSKGERLVDALKAKRPAIVIDDKWVATLPPTVREYVSAHFEATPFSPIKRRRTLPLGEETPTELGAPR